MNQVSVFNAQETTNVPDVNKYIQELCRRFRYLQQSYSDVLTVNFPQIMEDSTNFNMYIVLGFVMSLIQFCVAFSRMEPSRDTYNSLDVFMKAPVMETFIKDYKGIMCDLLKFTEHIDKVCRGKQDRKEFTECRAKGDLKNCIAIMDKTPAMYSDAEITRWLIKTLAEKAGYKMKK